MVESINIFGSGLNTDDTALIRNNGDSQYRLDVIYGQDGEFGSIVGIKAAEKIAYTIPELNAWTNKTCIGSCEYIHDNSIIFLLYGETSNPFAKHVAIVEAFQDDTFQLVGYLPSEMLSNYTKDIRIQPYILDKFLGFTDAINEPILINIERAKLYQQYKTFRYLYQFTPEINTNDIGYFKGYGLYRYKGSNVVAPDDYYVLRAIRDANPNSLLTTEWADDKDPYTQWKGVYWDEQRQHVWRLILDDFNISTLPDVNKLSGLIVLTANRNSISSINVDGLLKLDNLQLDSNLLSNLNVSTNSKLTCLFVKNNEISSLSVNGTILRTLECDGNSISSLDLSVVPTLMILSCKSNVITSINLSGLNLDCLYLNNNLITTIPSLISRQSIIVGDASFVGNPLTVEEISRLYSIGYTESEIGAPDANNEIAVLKQIRDANPSSALPVLWMDSEDPYTQWEGLVFSNSKVAILDVSNRNLLTFNGLNNFTTLQELYCSGNNITSIQSLTSKGNIVDYDFTNNRIGTAELDRLRALGFTDDAKLLPQKS